MVSRRMPRALDVHKPIWGEITITGNSLIRRWRSILPVSRGTVILFFSNCLLYSEIDCIFFNCIPRNYTVKMLHLVGLGLADETDITVRGLEIVKRAERVYLEAYTSILLVDKEKLVS